MHHKTSGGRAHPRPAGSPQHSPDPLAEFMEEKWKGTEDYREKGEERVREGKGREWKGRDSPFLQTYFAFLQASGRMCP